jgi:selenocysteine lyase/cysteine desulfurase
MSETFDISKARDRFPALKQDQVFLDNAGGSQALGDVIDSYVKVHVGITSIANGTLAYRNTSPKTMFS